MTDEGLWNENSIGLLLVTDHAGGYGVASADLDGDPSETAERLLGEALSECDRDGQLPVMIWIYQAPGHEEAVLSGLRRMVGDSCPIIGGSAADNDVSGKWSQIGTHASHSNGLVIAVAFPSRPVGSAFQGGYEPAGPSGVVTGIGYVSSGESGIVTESNGRTILSIDNEPAAQVYNRWLDSLIADRLDSGGTILQDTTLQPIATEAARIEGVATYLLVHPASVGEDGSLSTFRSIGVGERVFAMRGDKDRLVSRAGRTAQDARRELPASSELAGGLVVYCGGCRMAVDDSLASVVQSVKQAFGDKPFIGCFTFGEQGLLNDRNVHGNLMISAISFAS